MQTTAIRTVANSLPEKGVILLTLLISDRYILFAELVNIFEKALGRSHEIEFLPWPGIYFLSNPGNFPIRDRADVRPLGYILPDQLVPVLYGPFLPCTVRIGKEYRDMEFPAYPLMLGELAAVVRGDGLQRLSLVRQQQSPHGSGKRFCLFPMPELFHEQEVRASLRERQDGVAVPVHDEIHLSIAKTFPVGFCRAFMYAYPVTDVCALVSCLCEALRLYFILWRQWEASSPLPSLRMIA